MHQSSDPRSWWHPGGEYMNRRWTPEEDEIVRQCYPDYRAMALRLPRRNSRAMRHRAGRLGLWNSRHCWTAAQISRLRNLWEAGASNDELTAAFPGIPYSCIAGRAQYAGLGSRNRSQRRFTGNAFRDSVLRQAIALRVSARRLDSLAKTGSRFASASSSLNDADYASAAEALGMTVRIAWQPTD